MTGMRKRTMDWRKLELKIKITDPFVDSEQMSFLERLSTFLATVSFVIFTSIVVFFVFVNSMSSKMN